MSNNGMGGIPSAVHVGTSLWDFSVPSHPKGRTLFNGNYIIAKVEGEKMVLTSSQVQNYLNLGLDVEVLGYMRE